MKERARGHLVQLVLIDLRALLRGLLKGVANHAALRALCRLGHELVVNVWEKGEGRWWAAHGWARTCERWLCRRL